MKQLTLTLIISLLTSTMMLTAQEVVSSGGTHASGSGVSLSWTIGEPVSETLTNGTYTLTQGFHQSRLSATAVDDILIPGVSLAVYPNPFSSVLQVKVGEGDFSQLQYSLLSLDGKVLLSNKLTKTLSQIDMQSFASGSYLLRIHGKTGEPVKTFKVVKQ
jgi:hypothetical protein